MLTAQSMMFGQSNLLPEEEVDSVEHKDLRKSATTPDKTVETIPSIF